MARCKFPLISVPLYHTNPSELQDEHESSATLPQENLVKKEQDSNDEGNEESNKKPINGKVESTSGSLSANTSGNANPVEIKVDQKSDSSHSLSLHSSNITSTTKIYANLESAMPVGGTSPQPPITIQTIEV